MERLVRRTSRGKSTLWSRPGDLSREETSSAADPTRPPVVNGPKLAVGRSIYEWVSIERRCRRYCPTLTSEAPSDLAPPGG